MPPAPVRSCAGPFFGFAGPTCYGKEAVIGNFSAAFARPNGRRATPMVGPAQRVAEAEPSDSVIQIL